MNLNSPSGFKMWWFLLFFSALQEGCFISTVWGAWVPEAKGQRGDIIYEGLD